MFLAAVLAYLVVHFTTLAHDKVTLDGYLYQPAATAPGKHPAVVFLHGCGGLLGRKSHVPLTRETAWAKELNDLGYTVLMVDSFTPRHVTQMCAPATFRDDVYLARPYDAYAALAYLQAQPGIDPAHIGVMGWSQGGGVTLFSIGKKSPHNPSGFAAAVAFYPGSCSTKRLGSGWSSTIPLLVLIGANDVWTPAAACDEALKDSAQTHIKVYPDAYHDFDWAGVPVHESPAYTTSAGVIPIEGENPAARADAMKIVPAFLEQYLGK